MNELYLGAMFVLFIAMLGGLLKFHHHKLPVVAVGFVALSIVFIIKNGVGGWGLHFADHHRSHLLLQLAMLLPGFSLAAHYFEHSGASRAIADRLDTSRFLEWVRRTLGGAAHAVAKAMLSPDAMLLWIVFTLSIVLDNIAAAMIGGTILMARYGASNVPFSMLVGVIGASNLGGAGSPVGDTTTVMMFISTDPKIPVENIFKAFAATLPAQMLLVLWATRHGQPALAQGMAEKQRELQAAALAAVHHGPDDLMRGVDDAEALAEGVRQKGMKWRMVLPLLAVPGIIIGNLFDQPGLGLWTGLLLGMLLGWVKFEGMATLKAVPNTVFLVVLVGAAEMLPFNDIVPMLLAWLKGMQESGVAPFVITMILLGLVIATGIASAYFDNIPLMAVMLTLMRLGLILDAGLTAYCLGFEGSAMWFGSSAGVAIGLQFKEVYDTKKWVKPYFAVTGIYLIGALAYILVFYGIVPLFS